MSLSKTLYPLLSAGSVKENPSRHDEKIVDWDVKNQNKQANSEIPDEILPYVAFSLGLSCLP